MEKGVNMNKLDNKIRKLREEIRREKTEPHNITSRSPWDILDDVLSIMEEGEKEVDPYDQPCCGDFENCTNACAPRADYWKENKRVELNKLALSILTESFRQDPDYKRTWVDNISMAIYEVGFGIDERIRRNRAAELFLERLFGIDERSNY